MRQREIDYERIGAMLRKCREQKRYDQPEQQIVPKDVMKSPICLFADDSPQAIHIRGACRDHRKEPLARA
jgi:hypothetical protein